MGERGCACKMEDSGITIEGFIFWKLLKDFIRQLLLGIAGWGLVCERGSSDGTHDGGGGCVRCGCQGAVGRWDHWYLPLQ